MRRMLSPFRTRGLVIRELLEEVLVKPSMKKGKKAQSGKSWIFQFKEEVVVDGKPVSFEPSEGFYLQTLTTLRKSKTSNGGSCRL